MSSISGSVPETPRDVLGTEWVSAEDVVIDVRGWRTTKKSIRVDYIDWTINGRTLSSLLSRADGGGINERTQMIRGEEGTPYPVESLRALLHGYQVNDEAWVRFADGRTAVMFCSSCADLNCATVSARVEFTPTTVRWSDLAYQVDYSDEIDSELFEPMTFTFERAAYEATIREQLRAWGG